MLLPVTYRVNERGHAEVGGCDLVELAHSQGTPLYVYDEETVRSRCREFREAMGDEGEVLYAAKAFASPGFLQVVASEGLGLDAVSAGELHLAAAAGFPPERIHLLGNNKSAADLEAAWRAGANLVLESFHEFDLLRRVVPVGSRLRCLVRLSPGVRPDTHEFIATGQRDSKFGFSVESGAARAAVEEALQHDRLELVGLHFHVGSQIFGLDAHRAAMEVALDLAAGVRRDLGWQPERLDAGGGLAIAHTPEDEPPAPRRFVEGLLAALEEGAAKRGLRQPRLAVEPGRAVAGPAGVALYTVGAIKETPGGRRLVAVDGGMGDNIRPKLYGATYTAFLAADPQGTPDRRVSVVGKYCESTDVLVEDCSLPPIRSGEVLCLPATGAYCLSMASNYNGFPRPAAVMVAGGRARVIRRRETLDDLLAAEVF